MERNCPAVAQPDAANPATRKGAFAVSSNLAGCGEQTPDETAQRFGSIEGAYTFVAAVNRSQEELLSDPAVIAATYNGDAPAVNIGCECSAECNADCECSMSVLFNSERTAENCNSVVAVHALLIQPAPNEPDSPTVKPIARERRSRARGRPPDTQPGQSCTDRAPMSSQVPLKKTTPGNGSATELKVPSATLHECMGSSPGRHPVVSSVNAVAVLGVIHRDINCLRSSEVCSRSKDCDAGCECSGMLPAHHSAASVAQSETHTLENESTSLLGGHPSGVRGSPLASSASACCSDSRHIANQTETHCSQLKETSPQAEQSSAAPEMVTASRMPTTPRVVVTGHSVSSPEESRLDSSSLSETAGPLVFNLHSYLTGQPPQAQTPGECIASFCRQPELLNGEQIANQSGNESDS